MAKSPTALRNYYMIEVDFGNADQFIISLDTLTSIGVLDSICSTQHLILSQWSSPTRTGPIRKNLLSYDSFDALVDTKPTSVLAFYDELQTRAQYYLVGLTPFNAINTKFPIYGLCIPGVGRHKYQMMATALFDVLQVQLPKRNATLTNLVSIVCNSGGDGYALLWSILKSTLPGFDNIDTPDEPLWDDYRDIALFANAYMMYIRLARFRREHYTDVEKSLKFLAGIKNYSYMGILSGLTLQVSNHIPAISEDPGSLPASLQIPSLAITITDQMKGLVMDSELTGARRVLRASRHDGVATRSGNLLDIDSDSDDDFQAFDLPGIDPVVRAARDQRSSRPLRSSTNVTTPFRRPRRNFDASKKCGACHMLGHMDADCFHLARAVFLAKYMNDPRNARACEEIGRNIEATWLAQHQVTDSGKRINSKKVLKAYMDKHQLDLPQMEHLLGPDPDSLWMNPASNPEDSGTM